MKAFDKTYSLDNSTETTEPIERGRSRIQELNSSLSVSAVDADVTVKLYLGNDLDNTDRIAEKTLTNTTVTAGTTNIYDVSESAAKFLILELTSVGTTDVHVFCNTVSNGVR